MTADAIYLDANGNGEFSVEDKLASFADDNPAISDSISVQVSAGSIVDFDWTKTANIPLIDAPPTENDTFLSSSVMEQKLSRRARSDSEESGQGQSLEIGILKSTAGQKFKLMLRDYDLKEAHGGEGDEFMDASTVNLSGVAQTNDESGLKVNLYGGEGHDTLRNSPKITSRSHLAPGTMV